MGTVITERMSSLLEERPFVPGQVTDVDCVDLVLSDELLEAPQADVGEAQLLHVRVVALGA